MQRVGDVKFCPDCKTFRPITEFGPNKRMTDGLQGYCRTHMNERTNQSNHRGQPPPSTLLGKRILEANGHPCVMGGARNGYPFADLIAWGCIPVESKITHGRLNQNGSLKCAWRITPLQAQNGFYGFVLLLAALPAGGIRSFVIPGNHPMFSRGHKSVCATLDSPHGRANGWKQLAPFEDAFHLIEKERAQYHDYLRGLGTCSVRLLAA